MDTNQTAQSDDSVTPEEISLPAVVPDNSSVTSSAQSATQNRVTNSDPRLGDIQQKVLDLPQEAQDTDLIEKEWVEKAKQIVQHTGDDPYSQQLELSKMKADYMKKRYNKDIKVSDS